MTTRTFKQQGQAYGSLPVAIVAKIDGVEVFNGTVPTLDEPYQLTGTDPVPPGGDLFSWTDDLAFSGTKTMEISVANGFLVVMETVANYAAGQLNPTAEEFGFPYLATVGDVAWTNATTNITINGVLQNQDNGCPGQTYWLVPPGQTYSCTVNVTAGELKPVYPPK